jgi:hypothetical protein
MCITKDCISQPSFKKNRGAKGRLTNIRLKVRRIIGCIFINGLLMNRQSVKISKQLKVALK